jgi:hypothetical protein
MNARITDIEILREQVLVSFADGSAALFNAEFLYENRDKDGNTLLLKNDESPLE